MPRTKSPSGKTSDTGTNRPSKLQMADIARLANVSISTVSRALSDNPRLSAETRTRVNELAKTLNYSINAGAQILRGKAMQTVAVAFPYHPDQRHHFKDPFFLATLGSIGDALIDSGYSMLIVGVETDKSDALTQAFEKGQSIGTIILGQENNHQRFNELAVRGMPFVVWGARLPDQLYCTVGSDNVLGGRQATEHLLACGAKRIAFFGDIQLAEIGQRYEGYRAALESAKLVIDPELLRSVSFVVKDVEQVIDEVIRGGLNFDAVFAGSDLIALTVISALRSHGLSVPEDVQVVGFDDIRMASEASPTLTTVHQPIDEAGRVLVQLLMDKLDGRQVESVVMPTVLKVRGSTRSSKK